MSLEQRIWTRSRAGTSSGIVSFGPFSRMALPYRDHRLLRWLARLDALPSPPEQTAALEEISIGGVLTSDELSDVARTAHGRYRRAGLAGDTVDPRVLCLVHEVLIVPVDAEQGFARFRADLRLWVVSIPARAECDQQRTSFELLHEFAETLVGDRSHPDVQTLVPLLAIERAAVGSAIVRSGGLERAIARLRRRHPHLPAWVVAVSALWHGLDAR